MVDVSSTGWNSGVWMAPKLASCDVFGMLLKYGLPTEGGFGGGEKPILAGVLVNGIGLLSLLVSVTGGDMTHSCEEFVLCDVCCCAVYWLSCYMCYCSEPWTVCCIDCCCCGRMGYSDSMLRNSVAPVHVAV